MYVVSACCAVSSAACNADFQGIAGHLESYRIGKTTKPFPFKPPKMMNFFGGNSVPVMHCQKAQESSRVHQVQGRKDASYCLIKDL